MLTDILTGRARQIVYAIWKIIAVVTGTIQVGYLTVGQTPTWVAIAIASVMYIGVAIGALAQDNVPLTGNVTVPSFIGANVGKDTSVPAGYVQSESGIVKTNGE